MFGRGTRRCTFLNHTINHDSDSRRKSDDNTTRALSLREINLARALYRCGDKDGLARKILTQYTHDLRGHFASHAHAVLEETSGAAQR